LVENVLETISVSFSYLKNRVNHKSKISNQI
jgi:hypothetical protein